MATRDEVIAKVVAILDANKTPNGADYVPLSKRKLLLPHFNPQELALDVDDFFERELLPAMKKVHTKRMKQERRKHRHG